MTALAQPGHHLTRAIAAPSLPRRFLRLGGNAVLALVALAATAVAVLVLVLHIGVAAVLSPSMTPGYAPGDLLVTRPVAATGLAVGDVVVLPRPDAPGERYAHRVISVDAAHGAPVVRTKGDANTAADPQALRITSAEVPVVVADVPWAGRFALLGGRAGVRVAVIILCGLLVLVAVKRLLWRGAR